MILKFFDKVHSDLFPLPFRKAVLYSLLIPGMVISINTNVYHPFYLTVICLLIGYKHICPFMDLKQYKFIEILKMTGITFLASAFFSLLGLRIMSWWGVTDPQGLKNVVFSNAEYIDFLIRLPFVAIGEEFLKLLMFLAFFSLFSFRSVVVRVMLATLLSSFIFGHLHIFGYELTAGVPLMLGAIPTFYLMLYYRSIIPLIIEHFLLDLYSATAHTQYGDLFMNVCIFIFTIVWFVGLFKDLFKKRPTAKS